MSAEEFNSKPKGQKLLIINRLKDLIKTDSPILQTATADMIGLLLRIGLLESPTDYCYIFQSALEWGFDKSFTPTWSGNESIRIELNSAAKASGKPIMDIISKCFIDYINRLLN
jgi:hypothetical protein